jgi:hypothetical protein|tara:strand:- start:75879 stop:76085 length:207 start_codon:yes stop_codon:yes gene_type:complete
MIQPPFLWMKEQPNGKYHKTITCMTVAQQCVKQKVGVLIRSQPAPDEIGFLSSIEATRIIRQDKKNMS